MVGYQAKSQCSSSNSQRVTSFKYSLHLHMYVNVLYFGKSTIYVHFIIRELNIEYNVLLLWFNTVMPDILCN